MFRFPPLTPTVRKALIAFSVAFLLETIADNWLQMGVVSLLALQIGPITYQTAWQVFTYVFAQELSPGGFTALLIHLLFLWLMVSPFEELYGPRRTLQLMVLSTLAAALPAVAVGLFIPSAPLFGLSPILLGAIAAFAWSMRGRGRLSFFGVIPMSAMQLLYLILGMSFVFFLLTKNLAALVADLGAIAGGILLIEWIASPPRRRSSRKRSSSGPMRVIRGGRDSGRSNDPPRWLN